jgi:hypothetical protein
MKLSVLVPLLFSGVAFAGGTGGGSTPPAVESSELLNFDMTTVPGDAGLIFNSKKPLRDIFTVSADNSIDDSFKISRPDAILIDKIRSINPTADAIDPSGIFKSYKIDDGDSFGTFNFADRRILIRSDVRH